MLRWECDPFGISISRGKSKKAPKTLLPPVADAQSPLGDVRFEKVTFPTRRALQYGVRVGHSICEMTIGGRPWASSSSPRIGSSRKNGISCV